MAEEITFKPLPPPNNAPKYYYPPGYLYLPEPYHTTHIPKHDMQPRHHAGPLTNALHTVSHAVHHIGEGLLGHTDEEWPLPAPHADVRETAAAYFIDVELPGVHDKRDVGLKWTGTESLFLEAMVKREPMPEEEWMGKGGEDGGAQKDDEKKKEEKEKNVRFVRKERRVGRFARGFTFSAPVDQEKVTAKLAYGVLRIVIPKKEVEHKEDRRVSIEHSGN